VRRAQGGEDSEGVLLLLFVTAVPNTKLCAWGEEDSFNLKKGGLSARDRECKFPSSAESLSPSISLLSRSFSTAK
jgi:hypothetical protein